MLVRHAEAGPAAGDADRRRTERGEREAAAVGRWLAEAGTVPDRVLVSPARRARQTWDSATTALQTALEPVLEDRVLDNTADAVLGVVRATDEEVGILLVVGHNPSLGSLAAALDPHRPDVLRSGFPPGTAAVFDLPVPFAAVAPGVALLADLRLPGG